jgi:PhnB protein
MKIEPYLFFDGRCEEALAFYKSAIGAETTMLMRYNQSPTRRRPACFRPARKTRSCTRA